MSSLDQDYISHNDLLRGYKINAKSTGLVARHQKLIYKIAQLARGTYPQEDASFRWFYGLVNGGDYKNTERLRNVASLANAATYQHGFKGCYHQAVTFFLAIAKHFQGRKEAKNKSAMTFNKYIRTALGWHMVSWLVREIRASAMTELIHEMNFVFIDEEIDEVHPFTLNLEWIISGNKSLLFQGLTAYDRYILYLYFADGKSIRDISSHTMQSKNSVNKYLRKAINLCKENVQKHGLEY